jgi:outer membrane protein assembly factor BamE (lipoprotein component of BamABCDE complex)
MKAGRPFRRPVAIAVAASLIALAGCQTGAGKGIGSFSQTSQHGYVVSPEALEQIPVGSSKDQVLIALGSPSTTAKFGNDVFYYISQTRYRAAAFLPE